RAPPARVHRRRGAVRLLRRDHQLPAAADLHAGDALLPALDEPAEGERDGLATVPRGVELLARLVVDADVVDGDLTAGHRLRTVPDRQVLGDELGGRGALGHVDLGLVHGVSSWSR